MVCLRPRLGANVVLRQSFCQCRLCQRAGIDGCATGVIVEAGLSFASLRFSHNCSYSEKGIGSRFSTSCCKWVMQIAAVRGKIGNPGAHCKRGQNGYWQAGATAGFVLEKGDVAQWRGCSMGGGGGGIRKFCFVVRLCSRCSGGGRSALLGHRATELFSEGPKARRKKLWDDAHSSALQVQS